MLFFGTDGIRGLVDNGIDSGIAYDMGKALSLYINNNDYKKEIIIGYDTRVSSDLITHALAVGAMDYGCSIRIIGVVPTSAISYLTRSGNLMGVMITASHNSSEYNGIKCFDINGYKLSVDIENTLIKLAKSKSSKSNHKGRVYIDSTYRNKYYQHIKDVFGRIDTTYSILFDVANGVHYDVSNKTLKYTLPTYKVINTLSNGDSINDNCGALYADNLASYQDKYPFDLAFAFDGDADRLRVVTKDGYILSGDEIIYIFARFLKSQNKLYRNTVVGTTISSMSLEKSLNNIGIDFVRVDVGDRNVIEYMRKEGYILGGEESGHICLLEYNTSCDALFNALYLLKVLKYYGKDIYTLLKNYCHLDRQAYNIGVSSSFKHSFYDNKCLLDKISSYVSNHPKYRIVVRPSGTEDVVRVVVEGDSVGFDKIIKDIESIILSLDK